MSHETRSSPSQDAEGPAPSGTGPVRPCFLWWSKKDENHLALLQLASGLIAFKKAHLATLAATQPG
jgi:hypothetical protein